MAVRVTQIPAESSIAPTDAKERVTQIVAESSVGPTDAKSRVTQLVVEVSVIRGTPSAGGEQLFAVT